MKTLSELRQQILEVFPKALPPSPELITTPHCEECEEIREDFSGVEWWNAKKELIDSNCNALPLFTPVAFHYYLPAFLLRSLDSFNHDNQVLEYTVYNLSPTKTPVDDPRYTEKLRLFSPDQISTISSFLEAILNDENLYNYYADAERALRKFWKEA